MKKNSLNLKKTSINADFYVESIGGVSNCIKKFTAQYIYRYFFFFFNLQTMLQGVHTQKKLEFNRW